MANNDLRIVIYSTGTTALDSFEYDNAQGLTFSKGYPGGIFLTASFFLPGDPTYLGRIQHAYRVTIYNGFAVAWEGRVTNKRISYDQDSSGIYIEATGYWGDVLLERKWPMRWADTRVGDGVWVRQDSGTTNAEELYTFEQEYGHIHIMPRAASLGTPDYGALRYTMPTGFVIRRMTYNWNFQENVQNWQQAVWDVTGGTALGTSSITASGTGAHDLTLATPRQSLELRLIPGGTINSDLNKHVHAEWDNLVVYGQTGTITLTTIATAVLGQATAELSTGTALIANNTLSLVPFISDVDSLGDILYNAAAYGDSSFNAWAVGIRGSDLSTDSKPVLFAEQYPALTDYDYALRLDEPNVVSAFEAEQNVDDVRNWIAVEYSDESGRTRYVTPDDDANLKDTTSITNYGRRDEWISLDTTSTTTATNFGRTFLAKRKDLQWRVSGQISVTDTIRQKNGSPLPVSLIEPGKRLKIENYLNDLNGTGLTLLITAVDYDDAAQTASISVGKPDNLDVLLARIEAPNR